MLWLYLRFPDLYLQHLLQDEQVAANQAIAVVDQQQRILYCNQAALDCGVSIDMALSTAFCLAPDLIAQPLDTQQQEQQLIHKALWAENFSASISLDPPDALWLEVGSMQRLFNGLDGLFEQLTEQLQQQNWHFESAIAPTPFSARVLASAEHVKILDRESLLQALQPLSIDQLRLSSAGNQKSDNKQLAKVQEKLQRMGIKDYPQLAALPAREIGYRFGSETLHYLEQLKGNRPHILKLFEAPEIFEQTRHFLEEIEHQKGLLFPIKRLLTELCSFLDSRDISCQVLQFELFHRHADPTHWRIVLAASSHTLEDFLFVCRNFIERQQLVEPVLQLNLRVEAFQSRNIQEGDLLTPLSHTDNQVAEPQAAYNFDDKQLDDQQEVGSQLLNRLHARLEPGCVQKISLTPDPRPESQTYYHRSGDTQPKTETISGGHDDEMSLQYPLWLTPQPEPIHNLDQYQLISGPERFSTGWWDNHNVRRDYYLAKHKHNHQQVWIFQQQADWFVHGVFA
jgi:protein ImuB